MENKKINICCPSCNSENIQQFDDQYIREEDPIVNFFVYIMKISSSVYNQSNIIYTIIAIIIFMIFKAIFASENSMGTDNSLGPLFISILGIIIFIALICPLSVIILYIYNITISTNLFIDKIPYDFCEDEGEKKRIEILTPIYKTLSICVILSLLMIGLSLIFKFIFFLPNEVLNLWSSITGANISHLYFNFDWAIKTGIWCSIINIIILSFLLANILEIIRKHSNLYICKSCYKIINGMNLIKEKYKNAINFYKENKFNEAIKYFTELAEKYNDPQSQFNLGAMYENGEGTAIDLEKAQEWYKKSAEQGNEDSKEALKEIEKELTTKKYNEAVIKYYKENKFDEAFKYFTELAENGHSQAQFNLAKMYKNGEGTAVNLQKAQEWYKKSAKQGNKEAKEALADIEKNLGIEKYNEAVKYYKENKFDEALKYFTESAELGHSQAQFNLGVMYEDQKFDNQKAKYWYKKSADQGNKEAEEALAELQLEELRSGK